MVATLPAVAVEMPWGKTTCVVEISYIAAESVLDEARFLNAIQSDGPMTPEQVASSLWELVSRELGHDAVEVFVRVRAPLGDVVARVDLPKFAEEAKREPE